MARIRHFASLCITLSLSQLCDAFMRMAVSTPTKTALGLKFRWLEGTSNFLTVGNVRILVDPVFDTLDFGMPTFYKADKKILNDYEALTQRIAKETDLVLISQGLPDHCCDKTLGRLSKLLKPSVKIITAQSALPILQKHYTSDRIISLTPGQSTRVMDAIEVRAVAGSLVGPPTQSPENGYHIKELKAGSNGAAVYYEPHCMFKKEDIKDLRADVIVTPTYGQKISFYTILNSGEKAVELAKALGAKSIFSFDNVDTESSGILTKIVTRTGDKAEFERLAKEAGIRYIQALPDVEVNI